MPKKHPSVLEEVQGDHTEARSEDMKTHETQNCYAEIIEHPQGDLLRLTFDSCTRVSFTAEECAELREILDTLQPQMAKGKPK